MIGGRVAIVSVCVTLSPVVSAGSVSAQGLSCSTIYGEYQQIQTELTRGTNRWMERAGRAQELNGMMAGCGEKAPDPREQERAVQEAKEHMLRSLEAEQNRLATFIADVKAWSAKERERVVRLYDSARNSLVGPEPPIPDLLKPSSYQDPFAKPVPALPAGDLSAHLRLSDRPVFQSQQPNAGTGAPASSTPQKPVKQSTAKQTGDGAYLNPNTKSDISKMMPPDLPAESTQPQSQASYQRAPVTGFGKQK